jgi:hypothetical protein
VLDVQMFEQADDRDAVGNVFLLTIEDNGHVQLNPLQPQINTDGHRYGMECHAIENSVIFMTFSVFICG